MKYYIKLYLTIAIYFSKIQYYEIFKFLVYTTEFEKNITSHSLVVRY